MARILVTGNAGSGKSTLSQRLAADLGLTAQSLDKIVWQAGWQKTPEDTKKKIYADLVAQKNWLIDGCSSTILGKAETIIFLDLPLYRSLYNIVMRFLKNGPGTRDGLPENCPEYIGVIKAIKVSFHFRKHMRPLLLARVGSPNFIYLRSHAELNKRYPALVAQIRTSCGIK